MKQTSCNGATRSSWWAALLGALLASCAGSRGHYASASLGYSWPEDARHEPTAESGAFPGPAFGVAIGLRATESVRTELELSYRDYTFGDFVIDGTEIGGSGDLFAGTLMLNAFYDIPTGSSWEPYLGGGVGWAIVGYDIDAFGVEPFLDDTDDVFAVQLMTGVARAIGDGLRLTAGYRLLATENPVLTDELDRRFDAEFLTHTLELGLRFSF